MSGRYDDGIPELTPEQWAERNPDDVLNPLEWSAWAQKKQPKFFEGRLASLKHLDGENNGSWDNVVRAAED